MANYNCGRYIKDCISSLRAQTNDNWRCLICDDGSKDDSIAVIERFLEDDRIKLIRSPQNLGCIAARKKLVDAAETSIVGILDADDALYPDATEEVLKIHASKRCLTYSKYYVFDEKLENPIYEMGRRVPEGSTALIYGFVSHLVTFRRDDYYKTNGYDKSILHAEDRDIVYKLEEVTELYFIDKVLYKYRLTPNSQSRGKERCKIAELNHGRARRNALRRRNIRGLDLILHNIMNEGLKLQTADSKTARLTGKYCFTIPRKIVRVMSLPSSKLHHHIIQR